MVVSRRELFATGLALVVAPWQKLFGASGERRKLRIPDELPIVCGPGWARFSCPACGLDKAATALWGLTSMELRCEGVCEGCGACIHAKQTNGMAPNRVFFKVAASAGSADIARSSYLIDLRRGLVVWATYTSFEGGSTRG